MTQGRIRALLVASLTLNIFVVGALSGGAWMWLRTTQPANAPEGPARIGRLGQAAEQLEPVQRRAFRKALRETRRGSAPVVEQGREAREEATRLLQAPQVDTAALNAALGRARTADTELRRRLEEQVVRFAAALPPKERKVLAEALERRPTRRSRETENNSAG